MRVVVRALGYALICTTVGGVVGCGPSQSMNPWALRKENAQLKSALRQYQDQLAQAKTRADNLDVENEQLQTMLAEEQDARRYAAESERVAQVPRAPSGRYSEGDDEGADIGPVGRRPSSSPAAVASRDRGAAPSIAGAQVINDSDAVRIRVTNTNLFDPGKASLRPGATKFLDQVASSIRRSYPGHLIGIEGHTDGDPIRKSNWKDNHELSYQRARAVYDYLSTRGGVPANQLYIAAYGANYPIAPNSSSAGKAQNRRVEFVVRPGDTGARM